MSLTAQQHFQHRGRFDWKIRQVSLLVAIQPLQHLIPSILSLSPLHLLSSLDPVCPSITSIIRLYRSLHCTYSAHSVLSVHLIALCQSVSLQLCQSLNLGLKIYQAKSMSRHLSVCNSANDILNLYILPNEDTPQIQKYQLCRIAPYQWCES